MTMQFDKSVTTSQIIASISARLRTEQNQLDTLLAKARQRAALQPGGPSDALARLRAIGQTPPTISLPGRGAEEPRGARLNAPVRLPVAGGRRVTIRLPGNRQVRGYIAPSAVHRDDLAALRRAVASNTDRAFAAIAHNARAIDSLARSLRELAIVVAELQARSGPVLEGLLGSIDGFDLRMRQQAQAIGTQQAAIAREQGTLRQSLQLQARNASIQKVTATANMMQSSAFGTQGQLLSRNNLLVAGNNLAWSFLGNAFGWLSPIASLAVAQVAIGRRTQERFISGVADNFKEFPTTNDEGSLAVFQVSLLDRIAPAVQDSFRSRKDILVTATTLAPHNGFRPVAAVENGVLTISVGRFFEGIPQDLRVAWMVDTGLPTG
jgi:hypothetical protein